MTRLYLAGPMTGIKQLYAQVCLIQNNVETLKAWTPRQGDTEEET